MPRKLPPPSFGDLAPAPKATPTQGPFSIVAAPVPGYGERDCWGALDHANSYAIAEPHGHLIARVCRDAMPGSDGMANAILLGAAPAMASALSMVRRFIEEPPRKSGVTLSAVHAAVNDALRAAGVA